MYYIRTSVCSNFFFLIYIISKTNKRINKKFPHSSRVNLFEFRDECHIPVFLLYL